jgi:hypothetical protein
VCIALSSSSSVDVHMTTPVALQGAPSLHCALTASKQEFDHHTAEEEEKWVPELVQALDADHVQKLSERFSATKTNEPTR